MATMDYTKTMQALKGLMVETGSLACLGCGYEHNCSTHGCAIIRNAVEHMQVALDREDHLNALLDERDADTVAFNKMLAASEAARAELGRWCGVRIAITNADRIRTMSDEELCQFIISVHQGMLVKKDILNVLYWLQQSSEEEET